MADLHELLVQTEGTGVNVYTHGEMQPAHGYPKLKAFTHLAGNYGTAWQNQKVKILSARVCCMLADSFVFFSIHSHLDVSFSLYTV